MLSMNVADFVRHDCQHFFVGQSFQKGGVKHNHRPLYAAGKSIGNRTLLDEQLWQFDTERRARDLKFSVKIRTLLWRDLYSTGREDDGDGRLAGDFEQLLQRRVDSGYGAQRCQRAAISGMDVRVLVEGGELLVGLCGKQQTAAAAARLTV